MRLVTWNTRWCCGLDGVVSPRRIVDVARSMGDFDVLCLQEISQGFDDLPGRPGDQPAALQVLLPGFEIHFGAAVDERGPDGRRQRFGNLVASRLPVARVEHHPLPWPSDASAQSMPRMCTVATVIDPRLGAVRVMATHLEYFSSVQRGVQVEALRALHAQACAQADAPPRPDDDATPFRAKAHTTRAVLCGDFNAGPADPAHDLLQRPIDGRRLHDAWSLVHGQGERAPTFRVEDKTYGDEPIAFDFVFVSDALAGAVRRVVVDPRTRASDHQPVFVEI